MSMRASPRCTYKFYNGTPVYAFGAGLSCTKFPQNALNSEPILNVTFKELELKDVNYEAEVTNAGKVGGATSVLAYIT